MKDKILYCKRCNKVRELGRRLCRECYLETQLESSKKRYQEVGRTLYTYFCKCCKKEFTRCRKHVVNPICNDCRNSIKIIPINNNYEPGNNGYTFKHREIAETILGKLPSKLNVHHLDNNPINNQETNLIVLKKNDHARLHKYLFDEQVYYEKTKGIDYWNNMIVKISFKIMEKYQINYIKLWKVDKVILKELISNC